MPLLRVDTTLSPSADQKRALAAKLTELYTEEMDTTAGHVAVSIHDHGAADLHLGREVAGPMVFVDAQIRQGRPQEFKRAFALETMEYLGDTFGVPDHNMKLVFTEHPGENMMGVDRVGGEWDGDGNAAGKDGTEPP